MATIAKLTNVHVTIDQNEKNKVVCTWNFPSDKLNVKEYQYNWYWKLANGSTGKGSDSMNLPATTTNKKTSVFTVPDGAIGVKCHVSAISNDSDLIKDKKVIKTKFSKVDAWSDSNEYCKVALKDQSTDTPTPSISVSGTTLTSTVTLEYPLRDRVKNVRFQLINADTFINMDASNSTIPGITIPTIPGVGSSSTSDGIIHDGDKSPIVPVNGIATFTYNSLQQMMNYKIRCRFEYVDGSLQDWGVVPFTDTFSLAAEATPVVSTPNLSGIEENSDSGGVKFVVSGTLPSQCPSYDIQICADGNANAPITIENLWATTFQYSYTYLNGQYDKYYQARIRGHYTSSLSQGLNLVTDWSEWSGAIGPMDSTPSTPSAPTVELKDGVLNMSVKYTDINKAKIIIFEIFKDKTELFYTGKASIEDKYKTYLANLSYTNLEPGSTYYVRCKAYSEESRKTSEPSDFSSAILTVPERPEQFKSIVVETITTTSYKVHVTWDKISAATCYQIEWAYRSDAFYDNDGLNKVDVNNGSTTAAVIDLTTSSGTKLDDNGVFLRIAAGNSSGYSEFSIIEHTEVGVEPSMPTTWQSKSVASIGDTVTLYWTHNTRDGSMLSNSLLTITTPAGKINQVLNDVGGTTDLDQTTRTQYFDIDSSDSKWGLEDSNELHWTVQTRGALGKNSSGIVGYSEQSIERSITFYKKPVLGVTYSEKPTEFPINIRFNAYPTSQTPLAYYLTIEANESYETVDSTYTETTISKGQQLFYKHYNTDESSLDISLKPSDVRLESGVEYKIYATVAMNSGLTADFTGYFTPTFANDNYIDTTILLSYDEDTYSMSITPYLDNGFSNNYEFSVYRREYDGSFTEIQSGLSANEYTSVVDPHPAMNVARYRVITTNKTTGNMSYTDSDFELNVPGVIIQWAEAWKNYVDSEIGEVVNPWAGSLLRLKYNLDVSANHNPDVSNVEYIGREHPVSYYGTQLGESSSWNLEIPKTDAETLYAIRRLARYQGDVYVRESSGISYWANITVSYNKNHESLTIPVSFNITRVEGGV